MKLRLQTRRGAGVIRSAVVFAAVWLGTAAAASAEKSASLLVTVGASGRDGQLIFQLYDQADSFGGLQGPMRSDVRKAAGGGPYRLDNIDPGEYALVVFSDANGNGRLDRNFIGIPVEPVGFSSNYRPKGPPLYSRASFTIADGEIKTVTVRLERPLGDRGRPGLGVGAMFRSSPYRGDGGGKGRIIPSVSYIGNRLQIIGPNVQVGIIALEKLSFALSARPRFGAYDDEDAPSLEGLGDREDTILAGPEFEYDLPGGIELSAGYAHDLLGKIGSGEARLTVEKTFQAGVARITPVAGVNRLGAKLSRHDFGVPVDSAREGRPPYDPGATFSGEAGLRVFFELSRSWMLIVSGSVEILDRETRDSPIVDEGEIFKAFSALNFIF